LNIVLIEMPVSRAAAIVLLFLAIGMSCVEAAAWIGYIAGKGKGFPLQRRWGCAWPGKSDQTRLTPGVVGRLQGTVFEV
jgi:hypothetical protein